jgi:hypothetical protein
LNLKKAINHGCTLINQQDKGKARLTHQVKEACMDTYRFPQQKTFFSGKPFSGDFLAGVFADIGATSFTVSR